MSCGRPLPPPQKKELDTMKESISDIINQLQDIDPSRLSFSPFLDLDTQITLAPVSDSPESSVEELHSPCPSVSGSTPSLEPAPANHSKSLPRNYQRPVNNNTLPRSPLSEVPPRGQEILPNGTYSNAIPILQNCHRDESTQPFLSPAPESVELGLPTPQEPADEESPCPAEDGAGGGARGCCSKCRRGDRIQAFTSVLGSLLCAAGVMYALFFHVPLRPPRFTDVSSRVVFSLCCCAVASVPVLLVMLVGSLCQFCSGSLEVGESWPSPRFIQRLFVSSSLELLLLYSLNLVILAALLPQEHLMMVPVMAVMFVLGRLMYWVNLYLCRAWRGFGSGLTLFPLLACVALNLFLMYDSLSAKQSLFGS